MPQNNSKPMNVLMTQGMIQYLDEQEGNSRSECARTVVGAYLIAGKSGDKKSIEMAKDAAQRTSADMRKTDAQSREEKGLPKIEWGKKVLWLTDQMFKDIEKFCEGEIKSSDFTRGAIYHAMEVSSKVAEKAEA